MTAPAASAGSPREIFLAALDIDAEQQRQVYLDQVCSGDAQQRILVEELLAAHARGAANPLDRVIEQLVPGVTLLEGASADDTLFTDGATIDRYKLREQIGDGGMGIVYVAEQIEPVRRKVALKVIKPGMDSKEVIARFEAERQALALMDHPNVAHVLDAGTTPQGRPYFVMELVRGFPITEYCDQAGLDTRQRLELFVKVCQAVQHAHQKGIMHRDLKPSNVMVTLHDGVPVPKVIDFGVAKALNQKLTEQTIYTQHRQLIGTPAYMSPEQAEMSGLDIDTRSDVYSLGVLLYELLTGTTPFEKKTLEALGFDEMRRLIREQDPPRPSQRISTLDAAAASTLQQQRGLDRRQLSQSLRRELDWIVMRALEKDRNRRYESTTALADDVQRYLANEPVEACPPTVGYRLRKYAWRHKGLLTVATFLGVSTIGLIGATVVVAIKQSETAAALDQANADNRRAEENLSLALDAVNGLYAEFPATSFEDPELEDTRRAFLEKAVQFYELLATTNSDSPEIRYKIANAWYHAGMVQRSLEQNEAADQALTHALAEFDQLALEPNPPEEIDRQRALTLLNLGNAKRNTGRFDEAAAVYQSAIALLDQLGEQDKTDNELQYHRAQTRNDYGVLLTWQHRYEEAISLFRMILPLKEQLAASQPNGVKDLRSLSFTYKALAVALRRSGRRQEAREAADRCVALKEQVVELAPGKRNNLYHLALGYEEQASTLEALGLHTEALAATRRRAETFLQLVRDYPAPLYTNQMLRAMSGLMNRLLDKTELLELNDALSKAAEALGSRETHTEFSVNGATAILAVRAEIGHRLHSAGNIEAGQRLFRELAAPARRAVDDANTVQSSFRAHLTLAECQFVLGDRQQALNTLQAGMAAVNQIFSEDPSARVAKEFNDCAWKLVSHWIDAFRDAPFSVTWAEQAVQLDRRNPAFLNTLGAAQYYHRQFEEAVSSLNKSNQLDSSGGAEPWNQPFLAMAYWQLGDHSSARAAYERSVELIRLPDADASLVRLLTQVEEVMSIRPPEDVTQYNEDAHPNNTENGPLTANHCQLTQNPGR